MDTVNDYHSGDMGQVRALGHQYNYLLRLKEKYIADVLNAELRPVELRDLDVGFRLLTMQIKMVESKMHYLMFGGNLSMPETEPKPLKYYLDFHSNDETYFQYAAHLNDLRHRLGEQTSHVNAQTAIIFQLRKELQNKEAELLHRDMIIAKKDLELQRPNVVVKEIVKTVIKRVVKKETANALTDRQKDYRSNLKAP